LLVDTIRRELEGCTRCPLHEGRTNLVFGVGPEDADLVLVGEAPGAHEDEQGLPFVGAAGILLTRLMEKAGIDRETVYITNVVKCRPPDNRNPTTGEIHTCKPFLYRQMKAAKPKAIVTLGKFAAWHVTGIYGPLGPILDTPGLRFDTIPVVPLYHPSYLLRLGRGTRARDLFRDTVARLRRAHEMSKSS